ncbi:hypothetical protein [Xanthomonas campestris]|uniref:hypothetical protein n=1 Tax=Xanthomonas campestris TaxID=339 RepID=UPI000E1FA752|nr:hypothetical protein [Xanthomonas campestris]
MNVERHTALDLMRAFSRIEFALKQIPEFVNGAVGETPETQWSAFYVYVRRHLENNLSQKSKDLLLGTGPNDPPPMKMQVNAQRCIEFVDASLGNGPEGDRLMDAARRVRNNLVHGGKEHARQQRYPCHDNDLARAAIDVMYLAMASHKEVSQLAYYE